MQRELALELSWGGSRDFVLADGLYGAIVDQMTAISITILLEATVQGGKGSDRVIVTYPYSPCDDCGTLTHIHELARIEGPYGEFGEQGVIYLCWKCYMDRQEDQDGT